MVFGPPQDGPLGRLTAPPSADILRGSAPRPFQFYVGAYPQQHHIEISESPFGFGRRTAETPMVDHIKGRAFLPGPKGQGFTRAFR